MPSAAIASIANNTAASMFWGETIGFWIQTGAFVLSAVAAVLVIWFSSQSARKRATIDLLLSHSSNVRLIKALNTVYELHSKNTKLTSLPRESEDFKDVLHVLNSIEFVALGIRRKAFDGKIYQELKHSDTMKLWGATSSLIAEMRASADKTTLFQEFEWLVRKWRQNELRCHIN